MRTRISRHAIGLLAVVISANAALAQTTDWSAVNQALGRSGAAQPSDVMKYGFPRTDLSVVVRGVPVKPTLALGTWVAFKGTGSLTAMMMGDLVLAEDEVEPVMRALQQGGIEPTAVHNHVLGEIPRVMYMHVSAHGDPVKIAQTLHAALALSQTPLGTPAAPPPAARVDLDTAGIARALAYSGKMNGGVYQVSVARRETIHDGGGEIPPSMGVATAINFQPTGGGKAAITGDFVLTANEVNPVMRALREHGIDVTAVHNHMLHEEPRLFFMHFWANDDALVLAKGLRAALDQTSDRGK